MTPFKEKSNGIIKSTAVILILLCISESCVSLLQDSSEKYQNVLSFLNKHRSQTPSKDESRNSRNLERETFEISPYIRDVRADSRQSRIDARDIRTDFREIRTELRNQQDSRWLQKDVQGRQAGKLDLLANTRERGYGRNADGVRENNNYSQQQMKRQLSKKIIKYPVDYRRTTEQYQEDKFTPENTRRYSLNNIKERQARNNENTFVSRHTRSVNDRRDFRVNDPSQTNREDRQQHTKKNSKRSSINRLQNREHNRENISINENQFSRKSHNSIRFNEKLKITSENNNEHRGPSTERQYSSVVEANRQMWQYNRRGDSNLKNRIQRERTDNQVPRELSERLKNNRNRDLKMFKERDSQNDRQKKDTYGRSFLPLAYRYNIQQIRGSFKGLQNRVNICQLRQINDNSRRHFEPSLGNPSFAKFREDSGDRKINSPYSSHTFTNRRNIQQVRDARLDSRNVANRDRARYTDREIREETATNNRNNRVKYQYRLDSFQRNSKALNAEENNQTFQSRGISFNVRLHPRQNYRYKNQHSERQIREVDFHNMSERRHSIIPIADELRSYDRHADKNNRLQQHLTPAGSQLRTHQRRSTESRSDRAKIIISSSSKAQMSERDGELGSRRMSHQVSEKEQIRHKLFTRHTGVRSSLSRYSPRMINREQFKRSVFQREIQENHRRDARNNDKTRNSSDSLYMQNTRDSQMDKQDAKFIPNLKNNILINVVKTILIITLFGQILGNSSKGKLRSPNWRCIFTKEKIF